MAHYDIAVVGAGIAGAGIAAELAPHARVALLESEAMPGRHATGRSAAFWSESYGGPAVLPLTRASGDWLRAPPGRFGGEGFLAPRGALYIGRAADGDAAATLASELAAAGIDHARLDPATRVPGLKPGWDQGVYEPDCMDIDVARLHAALLGAARRSGAVLITDAALVAAQRAGGIWQVETRAGTLSADVIVNAAGAWADQVAVACGIAPIGIAPLRRTIVQLRIDPPALPDLPLVLDLGGAFYFKPEAGGQLWLSPHDETPDAAGDAAADEIDIACAIDRLEQAVDWRVIAVEHQWAGLRSFAPDRAPVYGADPAEPSFFWCAGQGGFGIQTAPAASMLAAALLLGATPDPAVAAIDAARYAPGRFKPVARAFGLA